MTKRENEYLSLGEVIRAFVNSNKLDKGLDKVAVQDAWKSLMGNGVNSYTTAVELKGETLFVSLSSSVLREELRYGSEKIIQMINKEIGKEAVKKLVLR